MKKLLLIALVLLACVLTVTSCGTSPAKTTPNENGNTTPNQNQTATPDTTSSEPNSTPAEALTYEYKESENGYYVAGIGSNQSTHIIIPDTHEGKPVIGIGYKAFMSCYDLESITLPNSITTISDQAFRDCYNLKNINLPESITQIGEAAFESCSGIKDIVIPKNVTKIAPNTFCNCHDLESITLPEGLKSIGMQAFFECTECGKYYS